MLPVVVHLRLYFRGRRAGRWWRADARGDASAWLLEDAALLEAPSAVSRCASGVLPADAEAAAEYAGALQGEGPEAAMGPEAAPYPSWRELKSGGWGRWAVHAAHHVALPVVVLGMGVAFSVSALALAVSKKR